MRERNFDALDERRVVKIEAARTCPVAGAGEFEIFETPADRDAEGVVEFGSLARWEREFLEEMQQPWQRVSASTRGVEPARPGNVGFDVGILFEQRNETWPGVAAGALGFVIVPVIFPGDIDVAWDGSREPVRDVERERVPHGCSGDARGVEVVEERHVSAEFAELPDALMESIEKTLGARDMSRCVRKCTQEEQAFVEAD